jgi:hypothetical protein
MTNHLKKLAHKLYQTNHKSAANKIINILKFAEDDYRELLREIYRIERLEKTDPDIAKEEAKELFHIIRQTISNLKAKSHAATNPYEQEVYQEDISMLNDFLINFGEPEEKIYQGTILKEDKDLSPRRKKYYLDSPSKRINITVDTEIYPEGPTSLNKYIGKEVYLKGSMRADVLHVDPNTISEVQYAPDDIPF